MRHLIALLHGYVFGAVFVVGAALAVIALWTLAGETRGPEIDARRRRAVAWGLAGIAALGWLTTLVGAYVLYPWYRAKPPAGTTDFTAYPRSLLLASPRLAWWHDLGMEWKEHVSWLAPIALTAVAYLYARYAAQLPRARGLRLALVGLTAVAFVSAAVATGFGLGLDQVAPLGSNTNQTEAMR